MRIRDAITDAIRDPIMLFLEREFHMIASVESDELAALLADVLVPVFGGEAPAVDASKHAKGGGANE